MIHHTYIADIGIISYILNTGSYYWTTDIFCASAPSPLAKKQSDHVSPRHSALLGIGCYVIDLVSGTSRVAHVIHSAISWKIDTDKTKYEK